MILSVRAENFMVYTDKVELSLVADMRSKKLASNVYTSDRINILKSVEVYGANNVGKTCLINAIACIKAIILNKPVIINSNLFSGNPIVSLGVSFLDEQDVYSYDFLYNIMSKELVKEELRRIDIDKHGNEKQSIIILKDSVENIYECINNKAFAESMMAVSNGSSIIHMLKFDKFPDVKIYADKLLNFANNLDVVYPCNIPLEKTIEVLKNKNDIQRKVIDFIMNADLDLNDIKYIEEKDIAGNFQINAIDAPKEQVLDMKNKFMELMRITSYHKGKALPSMLFDSTGTKKIVALSSYIIDAIENSKVLVIDEIESSLHFKLTRAIIAMFNNDMNKQAQLIFNTHDISLMDCKKLMRKEQIWFVDKDKERAYLYSLADFTAEDGVRGDTSDIARKYRRGDFGALPEPDLIKVLLEVNDNA